MEPESVVFRGVTYRRYPGSSTHAHRVYFTPGIAAKQNGADYLHRDIWKAHNGPIPDGFQIHHVDHNPLNNAISNLVCMSQKEHLEHHGHEWNQRLTAAEWLQHLSAIRPLAAAWHSSPEGVEWHRDHGKRSWENREEVWAICEQCGKPYQSFTPKRFCSNACKSAFRRTSGADDVTRICDYCGESFTTNRYSKTLTCSRTCAQRKRRAVG